MLSRKAVRATAAIKQDTSTRNMHLLHGKFKQKQNIEPRSTKQSRSPIKKNTTERRDRENTGLQTESVQKSSETQQISPRKKTRPTTEKQKMKTVVVQTKSVAESSQSETRVSRRKADTERRKSSTEMQYREKPDIEKFAQKRSSSPSGKDSTKRQNRQKPDVEKIFEQKSCQSKERSPSKKKTKVKRKSERTNLSIQSHIARLSGGMRDGIVDKTKGGEERTNHQPNKNGENSRRNRKREKGKISECTSQNGSTGKQSESAKEDVSKLNLAQLGDTHKSTDTGAADTARDGNSIKPDSSRSQTESEYCYSSDPDWDTSVSSETSSVDLRARNLGTVMQHKPTRDDYGLDASLRGSDGREGRTMGSPFRSDYDRSPTESVMSCTSTSSDDESVIEMKHTVNKGDIPTKIKSEPRRNTTNAKDGKRAKTGLKKSPMDKKSEEACKAGKNIRAKNPDVGKKASEVPVRPRAAKQSRRVQSESVVRGSRSKKKRSSPSKRGNVDHNKERDGRMSRYVKASRVDGRAIVKDRGKGHPSVDVAGKDATKQEKNTELNYKLNIDDQKANESENESDELLNEDEMESTAGNDSSGYTIERKLSVKEEEPLNTKEKESTTSNDETECKVERKPSVRFSLPKREDWKYYRSSEDISMSSLSSDDAMMCDGYSDSSSLSSLISDEIWDSDSGDEGVRRDRRRFVKTKDVNGELKGGDHGRKRFIKTRRADEKTKGGDRDPSGFVKTRNVPVELNGCGGRAPRSSGSEEGVRQGGRRSVKTRGTDGELKEGGGRALRSQDERDEYKCQQKSPKKKDVSARQTDVLKGKQTTSSDIKQSEKRRLVKARSEMTNDVTKKYSTKLARCKSANLDNAVDARNVPNKLRMYITPVSSHPRSEKELIKYAELQARTRSHTPKTQDRQASRVDYVRGKPKGEVVMRHNGDSKDHERSTYTTHTHNKIAPRSKPMGSVMKEPSTPTPDVPRQSRTIDKEHREQLRRRSSDHSSHDQMLKKRSRLTTVSLKT